MFFEGYVQRTAGTDVVGVPTTSVVPLLVETNERESLAFRMRSSESFGACFMACFEVMMLSETTSIEQKTRYKTGAGRSRGLQALREKRPKKRTKEEEKTFQRWQRPAAASQS